MDMANMTNSIEARGWIVSLSCVRK